MVFRISQYLDKTPLRRDLEWSIIVRITQARHNFPPGSGCGRDAYAGLPPSDHVEHVTYWLWSSHQSQVFFLGQSLHETIAHSHL